jgi:hypothetical protein
MPAQTEDASDPRPLVSLAEAAAATGRHPEALRGMIRRGRLPAVRGNDGRLLVRLPADLAAGQQPGDGRAEAGLLEEVAEVREEAAGLRVALARAEAERDAAKAVATAEVAMLRETLERERARADRIEEGLRRPWWRRLVGG